MAVSHTLACSRFKIRIRVDCEGMFGHSEHFCVPSGVAERGVNVFRIPIAQGAGLSRPGWKTDDAVGNHAVFDLYRRSEEAVVGDSEMLHPGANQPLVR